MALWPFGKRSKTNSWNKRPSFSHNASTITTEISAGIRRSSSARSLKRSSSRRYGKRRTSKIITSQIGPRSPVLEDFPLPPNVEPSKTSSESHQITSSQQNAFINEVPRSNSSASSDRPHKRNFFRRSQNISQEKSHLLPENLGNKTPSSPLEYNEKLPLAQNMSSAKDYMEKGGNPERGASKRLKSRRYSEKTKIASPNNRDSMISSSSSTHGSFRAFRVRSFDVLSPRPKLHFAESPQMSDIQKYPTFVHAYGKLGYEWRSGLRTPINEELPIVKKNRVYGLADDLDSRGLREALERDSRRRDRKVREEAARAQAKLERKAEKQREASGEAAAELDKVFAKKKEEAYLLDQDQAKEVVEGVLHDAALPSETLENVNVRPASYESKELSTGVRTPMSWVQGTSQEDLKPDGVQALAFNMAPSIQSNPSYASAGEYGLQQSPDSDYPDEIHIETARAVRLSACSNDSPPPSPLVRSATLVHHSRSQSRNLSREITMEDRESLKHNIQEASSSSAWSSFFRKATNARMQKEQQSQHEKAYQTPPPEERDEKNRQQQHTNQALSTRRESPIFSLPEQPQTPRKSSRGSSLLLTPERSQPSLSIFPFSQNRQSITQQEQTTPHVTPRGTSNTRPMVGMSPLSPAMSRSRTESKSSPIRIIPPVLMAKSDSPNYLSKHISNASYFGGPSSSRSSLVNERASGISRSMASLESEGSWLSGKLNSRQSFSPIRNSAASLRHRYKDIEGHEDQRASIADDEYFSGVPPGDDTSDEDEREILSNYADDDDDNEEDITLARTLSLNHPVPSRPSQILHSPVKNQSFEDGATFEMEDERGLWREGLARRPTITRIDSGIARSREGLLNIYNAGEVPQKASRKPHHPLYLPMEGELVTDDGEIVNRGRDSPSPTLGRDSPFLVTPQHLTHPDSFHR